MNEVNTQKEEIESQRDHVFNQNLESLTASIMQKEYNLPCCLLKPILLSC